MNIVDAILKSKQGKRFLLDVRWEPTETKKPLVIFIHGFKGFKDWGHFNLVANEFAKNGFVYAKFNLSHNGTIPEFPTDFKDLEAFSNNTFSIELDDIGVVIDSFVENELVPWKEVDPEQIFLIGHSRGGGLAYLKAGEDSRVKKVASWAAIHDLSKRWSDKVLEKWKKEGVKYIPNSRTNQQMPMKYDLVQDFLDNRPRLDIPEKIKATDIPILVVHGTNDETLEVGMAHEIDSWAKRSELLILEGANHVFGARHPYDSDTLPSDSEKVVKKTIEFFNKN